MPNQVRPKKFLGQHFLRDENIARKIAESLTGFGGYSKVVEIGPGTGILTRFLINNPDYKWFGVELDRDSVAFLRERFPQISEQLFEEDFLKISLQKIANDEQFAVIGNFPYNISSQIVFKIIEHLELIPEMVGMFQKEMAQRIAAPHGNKTYGILSVLTQAFFSVEYLFQVDEHVFHPPPRVKSAVIRLKRKEGLLPCDKKKLFLVVKTAFNQRRKTLRNSLKGLEIQWQNLPEHFPGERPEQLCLEDFFMMARNA